MKNNFDTIERKGEWTCLETALSNWSGDMMIVRRRSCYLMAGCSILLLSMIFFHPQYTAGVRNVENKVIDRSLNGHFLEKAASLRSSYFIQNIGQLDEDILYYSVEGNIYFSSNCVYYVYSIKEPYDPDETTFNEAFGPRENIPRFFHERGVVLKYYFTGCNPVAPVGKERCSWNTNYFKGNDPEKWYTNVPNYFEVIYYDLWKGIDLVYRMNEGTIKYDLILKPGTDPSEIRIRVEGQSNIGIDKNGDLLIETALGEVRDSKLISFYSDEPNGSIQSDFILIERDVFGFDLDSYDVSRKVVIDPLIYSTFIGGNGEDCGYSIVLDKDENMFITGYSEDSPIDYPTTAGAFDRINNGGYDVMVTKMDPAGSSLVYSTFLGGSRYDFGSSISVGPDSCAYVTGDTQSKDYPVTTGAYDTLQNGEYDAFVTKLDPTGSSLIFSTFIGGKYRDSPSGITLDPFRNIIITGFTNSSNYPVLNAYDDKYNDDSRWMDAFVTKLDSTGSNLIFSTYVGGSSDDYCTAIALDSYENICITGFTNSFDYPTTQVAYDTMLNFNGNMDVFVTKFNKNGSQLIFSTFIGGNDDDFGYGITLDREDNVYITGQTGDFLAEAYGDFPTTEGAYDTTYNGRLDIFATKLNSNGTNLIFSTFIGGSDQDGGNDIAVDLGCDVFMTGYSESTDYPITKGAEDGSNNGRFDVVVTKLNSSGSFLDYSTYLGGGERDDSYEIVLDSDGEAYITGFSTYSEIVQYPTTEGAFNTLHNGEWDVIITKLNMTIDNIKPLFGQDLSDENATTGDRFEFEIEVKDDVGISEVYVQFRFGEGTIINRSMSGTGPYRYEIIISTHSTESLHYIFRARDLVGNWANTTERTVLVKDNDGPGFISDLTPSNASTGEPFKFTVSVSDNIAISSVHVEYRFGPEDKNNSTMSLSKENFFLDIEIPLNYSELFYRFSAVDNSSNWNSTIEKRVEVSDLFPPVFIRDLTLNQIGTGEELTFTVEVQDNIGVTSVYVEYWTNFNDRMNISIVGANIFTHELTVPLNSTAPINYGFHACDPEGNWANLSGSVAVIDIISPTSEFSMDSYYNEDESILLDGSRSYDNIGITDWIWMIDGPVRSATLRGERVYHTFLDPGDHFITLKVLDLARNWDIKTVNITIDDLTPPIANAGKDLTVPEGTAVVFNSSGSEDNTGIVESRWIFFDKMESVLYGTSPTYVFDDPGVFEITLMVADAAGNTGTDNLTVTVRDITPPTADAGSDQTVLEGTVVILNGTNSTDNVGITNWIWTIHLKDREVALYETVVSFNFTEPGNYTVTLTVKDGSGNSGSDNVTVAVLPKDIPTDDDDGKTGPRYRFLLFSLLLLIIMTCSLVLFLVIRKRRKSHDRDIERYDIAE